MWNYFVLDFDLIFDCFFRVIDPVSGRYVDTFTDQPGVQFYTTNSLAPIPGKEGVLYDKHSAFCLETQKFPDALHHVSILKN